jgi:4'-phosphopantetheinyl transferase
MADAARSEATWETPPKLLSLERDDVHVWLIRLDDYVIHFESLLQRLARDELERVGRYYFQKDRERFAVGRAITKTILGRYLSVSATQVRFSYNAFGKPFLAGPAAYDLRFNLSHSNGLALLALALGREVGVDVEYKQREVATTDLAQRFFSAAEIESLLKLPNDQQSDGFFKCWTRKEAYIKAIGEGLSFSLDSFSVSLAPFESPIVLDVAGNYRETARWLFWDVSPDSEYAGALAAEGQALQLRTFTADDLTLRFLD